MGMHKAPEVHREVLEQVRERHLSDRLLLLGIDADVFRGWLDVREWAVEALLSGFARISGRSNPENVEF